MNFEIELPGLDEQNHLVDKFNFYSKSFRKLTSEIESQQTYIHQLRQAILEDAMQGKLTQQNSADESASKLLLRIRAQRQKLNTSGKLKDKKE